VNGVKGKVRKSQVRRRKGKKCKTVSPSSPQESKVRVLNKILKDN